jgi:two-component system phosphate regulon sensor histidine kinase PhoR
MSLRLRLVAAFAYVLVLVLGAIEIPFALSIRSRIDAEVRAQAVNEAHLIAASASGRLDRPQALDRLVNRAAGDLGARVIVVDGQGQLLSDSAGTGLLGSSYADRAEIAAVLESGRAVQGKRRSDTLGQQLLYTAVPIVGEGVRVGAVRVTQSTEAIDEPVRRDVLALAGIGVAALLFGLALAWVLAGSLSRPLRGLAGAARRAGAGDLDSRAPLAGPSEQREVAPRSTRWSSAWEPSSPRSASSSATRRTSCGPHSQGSACGSRRRPCARPILSSSATSRRPSRRSCGSRRCSTAC